MGWNAECAHVQAQSLPVAKRKDGGSTFSTLEVDLARDCTHKELGIAHFEPGGSQWPRIPIMKGEKLTFP
jgi:hypothetical protein